MQNTNPLTEIGVILISVCLIAAATLLLLSGKIDWAAATTLFVLAASVFAGNLAFKAPSPGQQAQLAQISSQALAVLPTAVAAAVQPAQASQPPAPAPAPNVSSLATMPVPAVSQQFSAPIQAVQP